jgi:DNA invertase Pin-like site-specific DNA recombinase
MTYQTKTKALVKAAPSTLGVRLAKLAIKHGFSVQRISKATGASRVTVYNWFSGGGITNAYQQAVKKLILRLKNK